MKIIKDRVLTNATARPLIVFFVALSIWWVAIYVRGLTGGTENTAFTLIYPLMALAGGLSGLFISRRWGGIKSYLGSALLFLSVGLLLQFFGQAVYAYYIYVLGVETPYPSIGDVGFFGSILCYLFALVKMRKVMWAHATLHPVRNRIIAIVIPALLLVSTSTIFLQDYVVDITTPVKVFLDFAYPLGGAIYVSLAILCLFFARNVLGGVMRKPIFFLVLTLIIQYVSDITFLYQADRGTWYVGGINDYLYFVSYFCMALGLVYIGTVFTTIKERV